MREVKDSMGVLQLPDDCLWGAQTQRSLMNFSLGEEKMPLGLVRALVEVKQACAVANRRLGKLSEARATLIEEASKKLLAYSDEALRAVFPLHVWQTGSGTQSNMNANEVIATLANQLAEEKGLKLEKPIHPNDDVNASQSSNDVFPTAMQMACRHAFPAFQLALESLIDQLYDLEERYAHRYKTARTHLQDAVPMSFGQEVSGWRASLEYGLEQVVKADFDLGDVPLGGTAVGTGLNTPKGWQEAVCEALGEVSGLKLYPSENCFAGLSSKHRLLQFHSTLRLVASDLMKMANDVRLLASGPRCGLGELALPENEPGSSIMPGKVNPTQSEALCMMVAQVYGNDATVAFAASQGHFQLNVYMPVMVYNLLQSLRLLTDGMKSFEEKCLAGLTVRDEQMDANLERSLMLVTRLAPTLGYERCAELAKTAHKEGKTLRELVLGEALMSEEAYEAAMRVDEMVWREEA